VKFLLFRFRREVSGAVVGCGVALIVSAALRAATSDRAWLVGLMLLGVAVLVLGGFVMLLRHAPEPEPGPAQPLDLPGAVRDRSRPRPGPRTPLHVVVAHPPMEYPSVQQADPDATVVVPSCGAASMTGQVDQTAVLPKAGGVVPGA
jgi:hypothetical protein